MSDLLKSLREKQEKILHDAREKLDEITDETTSERTAEIETEYDAAMAEYDDLEKKAKREEDLIERQTRIDERQAALEQIDRSRRPGGGGEMRAKKPDAKSDEERKAVEKDAFTQWMRYGGDGLSQEHRDALVARQSEVRALMGDREARAQGVATSGAGGALVPEDFMAELVRSLKDFGPMNDDMITRVITTSTGADMPWPTVDDTNNEGSLIGENTQVTEQAVTYSSITLGAYKYTTNLVLVSSELLQDAAFDIDAHVRSLMTERVGRITNRHFTVGTGSSQPNGIVNASSNGVNAASSSTLTADELIDLEHSVDPAYRSDPSCRFMFNDATFKIIRKLKDGQGNYLWQPADLRTGAPASFLAYPYSVNQAMSSFGGDSPASDNRPVIFGAMNRYVVRRVRALAIRRLDERYADFDQVGFVGFTRADGELTDTAAVKHLASAP